MRPQVDNARVSSFQGLPWSIAAFLHRLPIVSPPGGRWRVVLGFLPAHNYCLKIFNTSDPQVLTTQAHIYFFNFSSAQVVKTRESGSRGRWFEGRCPKRARRRPKARTQMRAQSTFISAHVFWTIMRQVSWSSVCLSDLSEYFSSCFLTYVKHSLILNLLSVSDFNKSLKTGRVHFSLYIYIYIYIYINTDSRKNFEDQ